MVEMETEAYVIPLVIVGIISIALVVDVMAPMALQLVVIVISLLVLLEVAQILPVPLNFEDNKT